MTMAVCFRCGELKFGAFTPCQSCGVTPSSDDDLIVSIAMTDHYHSVADLEQMGQRIRDGDSPELSDDTRRELMESLHELRAADGVFAKMMARKPPEATGR